MTSPANNADISPQDLVNAANGIAQSMDEMGQRYVAIANAGLDLATTGLKGAAGNALVNKLTELKQQGEAQSARSTQVAQNMSGYGQNLGEESAQAASAFGSF